MTLEKKLKKNQKKQRKQQTTQENENTKIPQMAIGGHVRTGRNQGKEWCAKISTSGKVSSTRAELMAHIPAMLGSQGNCEIIKDNIATDRILKELNQNNYNMKASILLKKSNIWEISLINTIARKFQNYTPTWVKGHNGDEGNGTRGRRG